MRRSGGTTEEAGDGRWTRGAIALLLALVLACGSDGNGPMEPGNGQDIRGSYDATHEIRLAIGTIGTTTECPGSVTITTLVGNQFTGQVFIETTGEDACEAAMAPFSGTVTSGGAVSVPVTPEDLDALAMVLAEFGCVIVDSDDAFTGTFTGNMITVTFTADLECEGVAGDVTFTYSIEATRTA